MGMPKVMTGTAMPATSEITIGAPNTMPSCHRSFRVRDHGFFPQKVQPEGLRRKQESAMNTGTFKSTVQTVDALKFSC